MADTKSYLDYITQKKRRREKIENVDFSKMPEGVDVMAVAEELASGLAPEYADEIRSRAKRKEAIKGLDYGKVKFAEPKISPTPPMQPAPMPLNIAPPRPDVPPVGVAPTLPSPTKEQMPRPLTESVPQRAKSFARGTVGVASGAVEGFGNIAGALGALGMEADSKTTADFLNEFSQRHLSNPENDIIDEVMQGLGSTLPFMGLGRAVAGGTRLAGTLAKTQKGLALAKKLGSLFGLSSLAVANALTEGGHAAQELRYEGVGKAKQKDAFWKAFSVNVPTSLILDRWMIGGAAGNRLKAAARGGRNEFVEETLQNFITKLSQDKPIDLGEALYEGGIGAIVGGGMGAAFPGARPSAPETAPEPMPTLPLSPNLDETAKSRALQMAQTDPVAAIKSVTPSQAWPQIEDMARSFAEAAEADESIPAEQKRTAVQSALNEMLNMNLAPAPVPGAVVEGVQQEMPALEVQQDPQQAFMKTQMEVIRKVAEKAGLKGGQVAQLVADRVRGGEVRTLVESGMAAGKTADQMADEFLAQYEGEQMEAPTPAPQAETPATGQPEAPAEAITGRWSELVPDREAQGGQAVAAIDMTEDEAKAVILKTADGRYTVRSEVVDVVSQNDEDGLYFDSLAEAKEAVEMALPEPGKTPLQVPAEQAIPMIQAVPGAGNPSIPEAKLAYEAAKEQARAEGEPVFEGDMIPQDEAFTPPAAPDNPGLMAYEQASQKFPGLTQDQHKALIRGAVAANLPVPEEVVNQYPDMAEEIRSEAQEGLAAGEVPTGNPILKLIRNRGFINRENYEKNWKGELPEDDMRSYIRKNGRATISEIAEAAAEEGLIPEYSENTLFEAIGSELRERSAVMFQGPVKSDIQEQLEAVGRPAEEAAADAEIVAAYVQAEAARRGMTPEQFYSEKRRIMVERGAVEPSTESLLQDAVNKELENIPAVDKTDLLFHATGEDIEGDLRGGGYDGILWTAETPSISQTYIPESGSRVVLSMPDHRLSDPFVPDHPTKIALLKQMGFHPDVEEVNGRVTSWGYAPGEKMVKTSDVKEYIEKTLGYKPNEYGAYDLKLKSEEDGERVMPAEYKLPGKLFIFKGKKALNLFDMSTGESDLTDLQYHNIEAFKKAQEAGYDGVVIDDFAQTKSQGNIGHRSIGLFPAGIKKIQRVTEIDATHFDFEKGVSGVRNTPEYERSGLPLFQPTRASINVLTHKIRLGEFADSSSFIHEAAHDFLQDMSDYVAEGKASEDYLKFWEPVKSWLDLKDGKITRDQHEKFARGFEAFMREGKAPSSTLERVFRTFRDWLLKIYKSVTDLNVDLNDSMRQFFGDMLTAQEAELTALTEEAKA
ncbi:MAG: hypothetical protein M0R06_19090, partial [Sphaerochaeta sp.]|nr:hypothetical protein [Sphaerochaeta sp.]